MSNLLSSTKMGLKIWEHPKIIGWPDGFSLVSSVLINSFQVAISGLSGLSGIFGQSRMASDTMKLDGSKGLYDGWGTIQIDTIVCTGWWFGTFFIFHNIWDNPSHWQIFVKMVIAPPSRCVLLQGLLVTFWHVPDAGADCRRSGMT